MMMNLYASSLNHLWLGSKIYLFRKVVVQATGCDVLNQWGDVSEMAGRSISECMTLLSSRDDCKA